MSSTNPLEKRYDPSVAEPRLQKLWEEAGIHAYEQDSKKETYSVDTPPPYVSAAHLHVGHAMSYTQAEFVVRYKRMKGFNIFYPMGFDDNGLPTERFVEKKYKIDKSKISRKEFVELCLKETREGGKTYESLWRSMGLSADWSQLYTTISPLPQRVAQRSFIDLLKKGKLIRKEEPILWCITDQTALAQADLEDQEMEGTLNYVEFEFEDGSPAMIATTRPELIPATVAMFVHPEDDRYKDKIGTKVKPPLFDHELEVFADESVDPEFGTGLMMVSTWGDTEDVAKWRQYNLPTRLAFDKRGIMNELAGPYEGMHIKKVRPLIIEDLKKAGKLTKQENVLHVVNVCERSKTPVEFYHAPQWFISVLEEKVEWQRLGRELNWYPEFMKSKYDAWVDNLKWDWNISRERFYGVPFPVWHCKDCSAFILPEDKDLPVDPREQDAPVEKCEECGGKEFVGEMDVMDTWMTSSLTPFINARWGEEDERKELEPMSLRPQGFEIIRTWLFYSIVKSYYHTGGLPWKDAMISGWGLDDKGKKMSKSVGNFVEAEKVIEQYSADALRYWASGASLGNNLKYQEEEVKDGKRLLNKLWNAARFAEMHLPETYSLDDITAPVDLWMVSKLQDAIRECERGYESYDYAVAKNAAYDVFWKVFADNYIELVKHRLYEDHETKKSAQATVAYVLETVLQLWAPILPHVTEEIWQSLFRGTDGPESIHITDWPVVEDGFVNPDQELVGDKIVAILGEVRKFKTENNMSMNAELGVLTVDSELTELEAFFPDLAGAAKFTKVVFGEAKEREVSTDVKIDISVG